MKKLILVRHAKSSWKDPDLSDFERPLNKRGKNDAPVMGKRLKKLGVKPDIIISSTAVRASSTAKIFCEEMGLPEEKLIFDRNLYAAGEDEMLKVLNSLDDKIKTVMLFAHNPGLTDLSNLLSDDFIDNIPTAGVVSLTFKEESWSDLRSQCCNIEFF